MINSHSYSTLKTTLTVCTLCLFASGVARPSDSAAQKDDPTIEVHLLSGEKRNLSSPIQVDGNFSAAAFSLDQLDLSLISRLERVSAETSAREFKIILREGNQSFTVSASDKAGLVGIGAWGKERISLSKISSLIVGHTAPSAAFKPEFLWSCTLTNQDLLSIGWTSKYSLKDVFEGAVDNVSTSLKAEHIKEVTLENGVGKAVFSSGYELPGWRPKEKAFRSQSSIGQLQITWTAVKRLENQSATKDTPYSKAEGALLATATSRIQLPPLTDGECKGVCSDVSIEVDFAAVTRVTKTIDKPATFTIAFAGDKKLEGFVPEDKSEFSARSAYLDVKVAWNDVSELAKPSVEKEPAPVFNASWSLKSRAGIDFEISNLGVEGASQIQRELNVKKLDWNFVKRVQSTADGLDLQLVNNVEWLLSGELTAKSAFGKLRFKCENVAELKRTANSKAAKVSSYSGPPMTATVRTVNGRDYPVGAPKLMGGTRVIDDSDYWGYELFVFPSEAVELWVDSDLLCANNLAVSQGAILSQNPLLKDLGPLKEVTSLSFQNLAGEFDLPVTNMREYKAQSEAAGSESTLMPAGSTKFRVKVSDEQKTAGPYEVIEIEFARYPKYGWSGWYSRWEYPFQWHRSKELLFTKSQDNIRMDVSFEKLRRIELLGDYSSGRNAKLINTSGGTIMGAIYPGDVAKSRGVSTWNPDKEGLLLKLSDKLYVFACFKGVRSIEIEYTE